MIRRLEHRDLEDVVRIWLEASLAAHDFIPAAYWQEKTTDMRDTYLLQSETFVYENERLQPSGFLSLVDNYIAAVFVAPDMQGQGIGKALIQYAKSKHTILSLGVYSRNRKSVEFYLRQGFVVKAEQTEPDTGEMETLMEFIQ